MELRWEKQFHLYFLDWLHILPRFSFKASIFMKINHEEKFTKPSVNTHPPPSSVPVTFFLTPVTDAIYKMNGWRSFAVFLDAWTQKDYLLLHQLRFFSSRLITYKFKSFIVFTFRHEENTKHVYCLLISLLLAALQKRKKIILLLNSKALCCLLVIKKQEGKIYHLIIMNVNPFWADWASQSINENFTVITVEFI